VTNARAAPGRRLRRSDLVVAALALIVFAVLVALGLWQVQRLQWKEALIATIEQRIGSPPRPLPEIEERFFEEGDVEYFPVTATGEFLHGGERHFFATWQGQSGFYVYTPLRLDDGQSVFVNRGFVPFDRKGPATRPQGQVDGEVTVTGLARNPVVAKPSFIIPENQPDKNLFYWKDIEAMAASADLPEGMQLVPFFIDADDAANPGGLPIGGVTMVSLPNNHLQYVITWFGLAAALAAVFIAWLWRGRSAGGVRP
jgi:surfeit locus 1 family protein